MRASKWSKELVIRTIRDLEIKNKRRPLRKDDDGLYAASRKYFGKWNNAMKAAGYEVYNFQKPIIPKKLTPELSYFLGLLLTDGHMQLNTKKRNYKLSLYTSYKEEVKIITNLIKHLFTYKARIYERKYTGFSKKSNYDIQINSKKLIEHLKSNYGIPIGEKSLTIKMPKFVFNTSKENVWAFLRGIIDGDGSVKKYCIIIASGSYYFLNNIKKLLSKIGIKSNKILKDRTCMTLGISNKQNLNKLYSLIYNNSSFYYPRKKHKFDTVIFKNT